MIPPLTRTLLFLGVGLAAATPFSTAVCSDTDRRICYGDPDGDSQDIAVADLLNAANALRQRFKSGDQLLYRTAGLSACDDWTTLQTGTVLVLTKHLNPRVNSTVAYDDIAYTIDGGANGDAAAVSDSVKKQTLLGCGTNGGQMAVVVNPANPLYTTDAFKASGNTTKWVIIKVVKAPTNSATATVGATATSVALLPSGNVRD
ncbi:hypothetical protein Sste5346_004986 [Sporothrix stenoceras]|uniref:Uncharacterized protein n=1 Tax=Sporothrix stenoceras TaxID=5173 RepID=A0ABR3Z6I5_9PEZI